MSRLLEIISGRVDFPSNVFTPLTPNTGDSFTVRDFDIAKSKAYILGVQGSLTDNRPGILRIRSPHFHDIVNGVQYIGSIGNTSMTPFSNFFPELYPGDVLQIDAQGSLDETDAWCIYIYYENAKGFNARYLDFDFVNKYKKRVFSIASPRLTLASGGNYETLALANTPAGILTALEYDRYYAIVSTGGNGNLDPAFGSVRSSEWGNVRYPVSFNQNYPYTDLQAWIKQKTGLGLIPFFHSESINQILLEACCGGSGTGFLNWSWQLVELTQEANPLIERMGEQVVTSQTRSISQ